VIHDHQHPALLNRSVLTRSFYDRPRVIEDRWATSVDYRVEWPGWAHVQQFSVSFNPEKIVHFLTWWSGLRVSVVQRRPSFVIELGNQGVKNSSINLRQS